MKLFLASSIAFLSSTVLVSADPTLFTGSALDGISSYVDASAFCKGKQQVLADEAQWCEYATSNTGTVYGSAPIKSTGSASYIDVEEACGITAAPTAAPVMVRRSSGALPSRGGSGISRTSAVVPRGTSRAISPRGPRQLEEQDSILCVDPPAEPVRNRLEFPGSASGDPHFKTWTGDKFDYHGECDLVLVDNPSFNGGQGLKLHIRTTRVSYFSYIERAALQIGDDVLEFANDVNSFLINGEPVPANRKHHKTMFAGFVVRRDPKAISIRLDENAKAKIDFIARKNGFPAVVVNAGTDVDLFEGSLGLLGEFGTGKKLARDGETELNDDTSDAFALEWQVRDETTLFQEARFPQYPTTCTPPKKIMGSRLGKSHMEKAAEEACAHWKHDKEDCIFDVIATRDVLVAEEGHIIADLE